MTDDNHDNRDDDDSLFRRSVGDVKRYRHSRVEPRKPKPSPVPTKSIEDEKKVLVDMMSDDYEPAHAHDGDHLFYHRGGVQHSVLRKLKRGQFSIAAELDLHGFRVAEAKQQLVAFLQECRERNYRCVRIIHGKGKRSGQEGPVLKTRIAAWLPQRNDVLAFCSAIPAHGGTGAIYVLLKSGN